MSSEIFITLEVVVPSTVTLVPTCTGFTFTPSSIMFDITTGTT
jgi:hypothetical protein